MYPPASATSAAHLPYQESFRPMTTLSLNDPLTLRAIGILADVLDDLSGPERLECLMAANALRQVLETRSENALAFANEAFSSLEPDVRRQIQTDATDSAVKALEKAGEKAAKPAARAVRERGASPFLDAINTGKSGGKSERRWDR